MATSASPRGQTVSILAAGANGIYGHSGENAASIRLRGGRVTNGNAVASFGGVYGQTDRNSIPEWRSGGRNDPCTKRHGMKAAQIQLSWSALPVLSRVGLDVPLFCATIRTVPMTSRSLFGWTLQSASRRTIRVPHQRGFANHPPSICGGSGEKPSRPKTVDASAAAPVRELKQPACGPGNGQAAARQIGEPDSADFDVRAGDAASIIPNEGQVTKTHHESYWGRARLVSFLTFVRHNLQWRKEKRVVTRGADFRIKLREIRAAS